MPSRRLAALGLGITLITVACGPAPAGSGSGPPEAAAAAGAWMPPAPAAVKAPADLPAASTESAFAPTADPPAPSSRQATLRLADDIVSTAPGIALRIDVLANDRGVGLHLLEASDPDRGSAEIDGDIIVYRPAAGTTTDSFTYTARDRAGSTATARVTVGVITEGAKPIPNDDSAVTDAGVAVTIDVLDNDFDPDAGDTLSVIAVADPPHGTAKLSGGGTIAYTPDAGFTGTDTFTYTIESRSATEKLDPETATGNVSVYVNAPPAAVDDAGSTDAGVAVTVDLLVNDSDPDGDPINVDSIGTPGEGSVVDNADGTATYTPAANPSATDSFTYTISDGSLTDSATVTITINRAPVAVDDAGSTDAGVAVTVDLLVNDSDPDGDPINVDSIGTPGEGSVVDNADGTATYTPAANPSATDSFTYTISDGSLTDSATVTITINRAPDAVDDCFGSLGGVVTGNVITGAAALGWEKPGIDSDPDGDSLTVVSITLPLIGTLTLNADGSFTYEKPGGGGFQETFTYTISDGSLTDTATVEVRNVDTFGNC